ncbi:hypothetical protein K0U27_06770 [archaeon]|nr:hypothetical protein [archaeon]
MGQICKGICKRFEGEKISNGLKYSSGYKRCTNCSLFVKTVDIRCPCCNVKLRTRSRT